jgi:hypothetical protein
MTLDQARKVMDAQFSPNPPRYGDTQAALRVITDHYAKHPEMLKPVYFTDGSGPSGMRDIPGRMQDQLTYPRPKRPQEFEREEARGVDLNREPWANIQRRDLPNQVSGDLVQTLPGDASQYYVAIDYNTGKAALFRYRQPQIDPGKVGTSRGAMTTTMDRGPAYYANLRHQGAVQRELTGIRLKAMNAANKAAWEGR